MIKNLAKKYKEVPHGMGITSGNNFMEFYVSPSGTWTALVTDVRGKTCIVETGEGWESVIPGTAL